MTNFSDRHNHHAMPALPQHLHPTTTASCGHAPTMFGTLEAIAWSSLLRHCYHFFPVRQYFKPAAANSDKYAARAHVRKYLSSRPFCFRRFSFSCSQMRNHHTCLYPPCNSLPSITPFNMPTSGQHSSESQVDRRNELQRRRRAGRTATLTHRRKTRFRGRNMLMLL